MSDLVKPSLQDYLLVETKKNVGKVQLESLDLLLVPISEHGPVEDLEDEIDEMKSYLYKLSSDFAGSHQTIEEIDKLFERQSTTEYMRTDPDILKEGRIKEMISDANLLTKEEVDDAYIAEEDNAENNYDAVNSKMTNWFY